MIFGIGFAAWSLGESSGALQLVPEPSSTGTGKRTKDDSKAVRRRLPLDDDFEKRFEEILQRLGSTND